MSINSEAKELEITVDEYKALRRRFPSFFWNPNIAQRRAFSRWYGIYKGDSGVYPRVHIVTYGNRTGKTEFLAEFLTGVVKGNRWVNPNYCSSGFFDSLKKKRENGTLTVWWVCASDFMKQGGANYKIIKSHIPDAKFRARTGTGVYREIHVPVVSEDKKSKVDIVVSVKTHDQDTLAFAGENVDVIICDEPPPQEHWAEMSGRMVNKKGESGGRILIGGTPLKLAPYIFDVIEADDGTGRVVHDRGSIWENCVGEELPEKEAKRLGIKRNKDGFYDTGGVLSREGIENAIANWRRSGDPDELKARVNGEFTHISGRIYKIFNKAVHVIPEYDIPKHYPVIMVCDPHDTRPDVAGWFVVTPRNKLICIAEYPKQPYELITSRRETIPMTCDSWRQIEGELGISGSVIHRVGDPNAMLDPDPYTNKTKKMLYAENGFNFNTHVNDNLSYGHEKVRQMLYYDAEKLEMYPNEVIYQPSLFFFSTCSNHINYITKYGNKVQKNPANAYVEKPEEKWKDFSDLVRYACVWMRPFEQLNGNSGISEWYEIKASRKPNV